MTDIILGMGEVGETLFDLLVDRKFDCVGIDLDDSKCKNYSENQVIQNPQYLHVCLPGELEKFTNIVIEWVDKIKNNQNQKRAKKIVKEMEDPIEKLIKIIKN